MRETPAQRGERTGVAVDGDDARAARREEARVAAVPAGKVEHARTRRDERREAHDPGRRARSRADAVAAIGRERIA